ncbi:MAG: hypothetical protein GEU75_00350 [Dehalococcoidia bacterium]|nr:hypothetical protein [Dehalococcoidia bacterium]
MRVACDALLSGDVFTAMGYLTNEAVNEAMSISAGITQIPSASGYVIETHEEEGGEHRFRVRFETTMGDIRANATWQQMEGAWRVTSLGVDGV